MRIAHVITRMILGGAQENTLLTCEDLVHQYGDDVLLITGPPLGPEGSLLERAASNRVPVQIIPQMRRAIHPILDTITYFELKRALRAFNPEVVHTHSGKAGLLGRAAANAIGTPWIVHTVHGAPFHPYQNALSRAFFRRCERWAAHRCNAMISVADAMTELMVNARVATPDRFTTIYSGMEVEPFLDSAEHRESTRNELGYSAEHVVIGKIARLFHLKGHEDVIQAASRVVAACPQARFLFVGDGILRESLQRRIDAAGLRDHFTFTGLVPPERIPALISAMDIVVHTSLREGLARVLPQALLSGKPVVSYDIDGAREVVVTGETGYLVEPLKWDRVADAIVELASDAALRDRLGAEGRRRCETVFRHEHMTARIREHYCQGLALVGRIQRN